MQGQGSRKASAEGMLDLGLQGRIEVCQLEKREDSQVRKLHVQRHRDVFEPFMGALPTLDGCGGIGEAYGTVRARS